MANGCNPGQKSERGLMAFFARCLGARWLTPALGLFSFAIASLIGFILDPPLRVHDEFSYWLSADTLLHGRLSNPTPVASQALQSFHIVTDPSYASKYPIGTGLMLALGWMLMGKVHAGVWMASGLLTVSVIWMLAGAMTRKWANLGGVVLALHPFVQIAWAESLMNGLLPATGCALLTGGCLRLRRRDEGVAGVAVGCGVAVLALTRPFEGLCCTALCGVWLLITRWKRGRLGLCPRTIRTGLLASAPVFGAMVAIAAHNYAVTGRVHQLPYQWHEKTYAVAPLFVFCEPRMANAVLRTEVPKVFYAYHAIDCLQWYQERSGIAGWWRGWYDAMHAVALLGFPFAWLLALSGRRWMGLQVPTTMVALIGVQISLSSCVCWVFPHYLAPILPWTMLVVMTAIRTSNTWRSTIWRPVAKWALVGVIGLELLMVIVNCSIAKAQMDAGWARQRQRMERFLVQTGERHLIFVHYSDTHNVHQEWVYNEADPSSSPIVWAHDDPQWNQDVISAYGEGRIVWRLDADAVRLTPLIAKQRASTRPDAGI